MQIIPKSSNALGDELLCAAGQQNASANDAYRNFLDAFNQVLERAGLQTSASDGDAASQAERNALAARPDVAAAVEALGARAEQSVSDINDIRFTQEELGLIRQDLVNAGVPPAAFSEYDKLCEQPDGATLSQLTAALNSQVTPPVLTDAERGHMEAALNKIDPSGQAAKTVFSQLENGNFIGAWNAIGQTLAKNPNERHNLDANEISALCKAFKFSSGTTQSVLSGFGPYSSLQLNAADFKRLMTPGQQELAFNADLQAKIKAALGKTMQPRMDVARARLDDERNAGAISNKKADHSRAHIQKTVSKKAHDNLARALRGESGEDEGGGPATGRARKGEDVEAPRRESAGADNQILDSLKAETSKMARGGQEGFAGREGREGRDFSDSRGNSSEQGKGWDSLLSRAEARPSAHMAMSGANYNVPGSFAPNSPNAANAARDIPQISRQAAGQVEQAMLSAMRDGAKRLDLQLGSSELGAITVTLVSRNGEVSATIRSERAETAELMARQLEAIKANLEGQGVKVDKLEVQTQLAGNNDDRWQGLDQHNMGQEENARREELERLRSLSKHRNSSENKEDALLEQAMQSTGRPAGNSSRGINIVA